MENRTYNPENIKLVDIDSIQTNGYNPKLADTIEFKNVVASIKENGLKQAIMCRTVDGQLVIVDGEQRYTAVKQLGYEKVYVYDLGEISDDEAKALTIWMEVQVPFDEDKLAPLVVELNNDNINLPFTETEVENFINFADFDFEAEANKFKIKLTEEQYEIVKGTIDEVCESEELDEGTALFYICGGFDE